MQIFILNVCLIMIILTDSGAESNNANVCNSDFLFSLTIFIAPYAKMISRVLLKLPALTIRDISE